MKHICKKGRCNAEAIFRKIQIVFFQNKISFSNVMNVFANKTSSVLFFLKSVTINKIVHELKFCEQKGVTLEKPTSN